MERNDLIESNLGLVYYIAGKYLTNYDDREDLVSVGFIGLIKAADTFDSAKGKSFAAYAAKCIGNEIKGYLKHQNNVTFLSLQEDALQDAWAWADTREEIMDLYRALEQLNESEAQLIQMRYGLGAYTQNEISQEKAAGLLKISQSTLSRREKKILDRLRRILQSQ